MASRNYTYTPSYTGPSRGNASNTSRQRPPQQQAPQRVQASPQQRRPVQQPSGRYNAPPPQQANRPMKDLLMLAVVLFIVPLVGLIGIFVRPFLIAFVVVSSLCVAVMWLLQCFTPGSRIIFTLILMVLAILSMLVVIDIQPAAQSTGYAMVDGALQPAAQGSGSDVDTFPGVQASATAPINMGFASLGNTAAIDPAGETEETEPETQTEPVVASAPVPGVIYDSFAQTGTQGGEVPMVGVPDVNAGEGGAQPANAALSGAQEALTQYLDLWKERDFESMVELTTQDWRTSQNQPLQQQLYWNHYWWLLNSWTLENSSTSPSADSVTIKVTASLRKNNSSKDEATLIYNALVFSKDGAWKVDPDSLRNGTEPPPVQVQTQAEPGAEATPEPAPTINPSTTLWHNADGGKYYHAEQKCSEINSKYYDKMKSFTFGQLSEKEYSKLLPCSTCNAPK